MLDLCTKDGPIKIVIIMFSPLVVYFFVVFEGILAIFEKSGVDYKFDCFLCIRHTFA